MTDTRAEEEGTSQKRRVRATHRGSVTRMTTQLEDVIISRDAHKLKQLKQSLTHKLKVLVKFDDELIELVSNEQLEAEVEQADVFREWAELAIISLDDALESLAIRKTVREAASPSPSSEASEERLRVVADAWEPSPTDTTAMSHREPPPLIAASIIPTRMSTELGPLSPSVTLSAGATPSVSVLPHSSVPTATTMSISLAGTRPLTAVTFSGLLPPTSMSLGLPAASYSSFPGVVPSYPLLPPTTLPVPHSSFPAHGVAPQLKLPKLSTRRFNGDLTKWATF